MYLLKEIITNKKITINTDASIKEAMAIMYENKNGCVILLKNNIPKGIITESDIVNALENNFSLSEKAIKIAKKKIITADENRPVDFAFDILSQYNIRRIVLINKEKKYSGVVLQEDLFDYLEDDVYKVDLKISNIINKSQTIHFVNANDTIRSVLERMRKNKIGSLLVTENKKLVGIITEKDILKLTFEEVNFNEKVSLYMTSPIVTINEDTYVTDAIELMKIKNIRRVAIINHEEKLISVLTNRDILRKIKGNYTRILENKIKHAQEIMNFLPEPIIEIYFHKDKDMIHWVNSQAKNSFGEDIIDKKITEIIKNKDWKYIKSSLSKDKVLKDFRIKIENQTFEISGTSSKSMENSYIKLLFKDVTNYETQKENLEKLVEEEIKKRTDSQYLLMQQSKLATMGEMIGHIAHQWRQPLAQLGGIFMNLESAYDFKELNQKYLNNKINHGNDLLKYMSNTIEDFRNFFVPEKDKEVFNVNDFVKNAINIISASLTYNHIKINIEQKNKELQVKGYPSEFSQVILNLLVNSQDALLSTKTKNPRILIKIEEIKNKIHIEIEDNAGGIKEELISKVFDIYFTTKPKDKGTGLGLYMAKLIIDTKFNGKISVKNSKKGASFLIILKKYK